MISCSLTLLVLSRLALGAVTPIAPGPGEVFTAGSECSISWTTDQSETWRSFSIDLMSGSNSNMTLVTNVVEDLDGTDPSLSPYIWTCPEVDPYSTIYFYQFNSAADNPNPVWTTRFTIKSSAGETAVPPFGIQPNGDEIPWGIGVLRSGSSMASREKFQENASTEESGPDEDYSSANNAETSQRSSDDQVKGETEDDDSEGTPAIRTSPSRTSDGTPGEDSDDLEVSEDDEITSTKSNSYKSSLKDTGDGSKDSDATESKNSGIDTSSASVEEGEPGLESTSSRMKTVHSKPTSTLFSVHNTSAATLTLSLPSATLLSAQPVGCAGGINVTSSYCSVLPSVNHTTRISKLGWGIFLATVLLCLFALL